MLDRVPDHSWLRIDAQGKPLSKGQLTTVVSSTQPVAVAAIRSLNTAEIAYAQAHRGTGYTCTLEELSSSWGISGGVARAKQNGYVIALQGCAAAKTDGPVAKYSDHSLSGSAGSRQVAGVLLSSIRRDQG